jgi:Transglycosylase-like domain
MRTTTTALALAGTLLAAAPAAGAESLRTPLAGHHSVAAHMRAERDHNVQEDLTRAVRLTRRIERAERREQRRREAPTASPVLQAIAQCESGGDPTTDTGNGFYGKYQFSLGTWAAVGGSGNPATASEAEQDRRAAILYEQAGPSPWPVCGR